jgi:hypothetical protein
MAQLRIYAPVLDEEHEPAIIPFRNRILRLRPTSRISAVQRARMWQQNQACPCCRRITVEPVELDDALLDRKNEPIPGTATLTGFICESCGYQWNAVRSEAL